LNGSERLVVLQSRWQNKVNIQVISFRRDAKRLFDLQDQVRLTQVPAFWKLRQRRQVFGIAFRHTGIMPFLEYGDLCVGQRTVVAKLAMSFHRLPRRHRPFGRDLGQLSTALLGVGVCE